MSFSAQMKQFKYRALGVRIRNTSANPFTVIENDIKHLGKKWQHSLFLKISKFTLKAHFTTICLNITRRYAKMKITLLQNKTRRLAKLVNKI